jgi:hypothetical protein
MIGTTGITSTWPINGASIGPLSTSTATTTITNLVVTGSIKAYGSDLLERISTIERVLGIPEKDSALEVKYPSLKKQRDDYINSLEKCRTFERIKGSE